MRKCQYCPNKHYAHGRCKRHYEMQWRTPAKNRKYNLRKFRGMSLEEYARILKEQGGGCAICGRKTAGNRIMPYSLPVDHDHKTGKTRGILCSPCNRALGYMEDNPNRLRAAAKYLEITR